MERRSASHHSDDIERVFRAGAIAWMERWLGKHGAPFLVGPKARENRRLHALASIAFAALFALAYAGTVGAASLGTVGLVLGTAGAVAAWLAIRAVIRRKHPG